MLTFRSFLLSSIKYGDYDAVLHCYSEELGYQSFFSKNIYSPKSKKKAYLFPLNELELTVFPLKSGKIPTISRIEWTRKGTEVQSQKLNSIRMFAAEFLNQVLRNENGNRKLYEILTGFNEELDQKNFSAHLYLVFEILRWNGLLPLLSSEPYLNPESGVFSAGLQHQLFDEKMSLFWKLYIQNESGAVHFSRQERNAFLESMMLYFRIHFNGFQTPESLEILKQVYE